MPRQTFQRRGRAERLSRGLFGGEAHGIAFRFGGWIGELFAISNLARRENPIAKPFAELVERIFNPFDVRDVYSDSYNHKSNDQLRIPPERWSSTAGL